MDDEQNQGQGQINIELSEEVGEGVYSNLAIITHSQAEFIVDFIKLMPGVPKAKVKSRVILTPQHAKRLFNALQDNIRKFESINGPIKDNSDGGMPPFSFGGPQGEA